MVRLLILAASLALHELAHMGLVRAFGGKVHGARVSIVGLTAWVRGLEMLSAWKRYAVYLAGPGVNALLAIAALLLHNQEAFTINLALCVFNLLPILPLDGGRLAQIFLGNRIGAMRANRVLLKIGPPVGFMLMGLGLVQVVLFPWNISLVCAGYYIRRKYKDMPVHLYWECLRALEAKKNRDLPTKKIILPEGTTASQAVAHLGWDYFTEVWVGGEVVHEGELVELVLRPIAIKQDLTRQA